MPSHPREGEYITMISYMTDKVQTILLTQNQEPEVYNSQPQQIQDTIGYSESKES